MKKAEIVQLYDDGGGRGGEKEGLNDFHIIIHKEIRRRNSQ